MTGEAGEGEVKASAVLIAALLFAPFAAHPALAGPGVCKGRASDESGQFVRVSLHVEPSGAIRAREAVWEMRSPGGGAIDGLALEIGYVSGTAGAIGPPTSVSLDFTAIRTRRDLAGAHGTLELSPGQKWSGVLQGFLGLGTVQLGVKTPWGGRVHPELVDTIESAPRATAILYARDDSVIASLVLNPSDHDVRDRLFRQALAEAEPLAAAPAPCTN
jgi:hypothetical protein